jgi:hypothetical protein
VAVTLAVVADQAAAVDVDPVAGADKAAVAVKAADVVLAGNAGDDAQDVKKKIQVSSSALLRSEGFQRSSKVAETSHLTQWL